MHNTFQETIEHETNAEKREVEEEPDQDEDPATKGGFYFFFYLFNGIQIPIQFLSFFSR